MQEPMGDDWMGPGNTLTRLDETKQIFRNVIGRIIGNQLIETFVGLVTFSETAEIETNLSRVCSEFKTKLENATAVGGATAIFDAISMAQEMLQALKVHHPTTRLRIIVLTDGEDNNSEELPMDVCEALYYSDIVLDSIVIGTLETDDLFKISKHTGGYAFCPPSRLLLFQTFLLEPFLDISARPDIIRIAPPDDYEEWQYDDPKVPDMSTVYDFPPCRPHELEHGNFMSLETAAGFCTAKRLYSLLDESRSKVKLHQSTDQPPLGVQRLGLSSGRIFLDELKYMVLNSHPSMDIYVNEADMSFWKIVMVGPANSHYENGTFVLYIQMTATYPQTPPIVRFVTPILHPNITKHGRICHQILSNGWKPTFHLYNVMQHIFGLLTNPETDDAVDELATLKFWTDPTTANAEIVKYVSPTTSLLNMNEADMNKIG
jgi:ubiquitin-protein ligase